VAEHGDLSKRTSELVTGHDRKPIRLPTRSSETIFARSVFIARYLTLSRQTYVTALRDVIPHNLVHM
jgi:hypothetical protein